jgi:hypothetical protein
MHSMIRRAAVVAALVSVVAGCSSGATPSAAPASAPPSASASGSGAVLPVIISRELVVGRNRVLFSFLDASGTRPMAAPDRTVKLAFSGPSGETVTAPDGTFIWAIEDVSGVYVTSAEFPTAGAWTAQFTTAAPGAAQETIPFNFDVKEDANVVLPGEPAPSVDTPTLADVGDDVRKISSDEEPVEAFYETSVADALAAEEPFVLVFATPAFCQTQTCGPTLEKVKAAAETHPDVTFINVEPYQTEFVDDRLQPVLSSDNLLQTVPAADAYGLLTEPFVFVVDGDGKVSASFELLFTPDEMAAALEEVSQATS